MNRYGRMAHDHWKATNPGRFAQILNPQTFFSSLGQTVESQVQDLQLQLAGPDPATQETTLQKVGRLNMARLQAEEVVLTELVWIRPTPDVETSEADNPGPLHQVRQGIWQAQHDEQETY